MRELDETFLLKKMRYNYIRGMPYNWLSTDLTKSQTFYIEKTPQSHFYVDPMLILRPIIFFSFLHC